ncbi:MAG: hypothetical protein ACRDRT_12280, partial [Pseudonocardiaceae bacterium]
NQKTFGTTDFFAHPRLRVKPNIPGRVARAVREPARHGMPPDQVIGVLTSGKDQIGFTDTALSIRQQDSWTIVPYDELLATAVTVDVSTSRIGDMQFIGSSTLRIGDRQFKASRDATKAAKVINHVKDAVAYEETGLGKPLPAHPLSLVHTTRDQGLTAESLGWATMGVTGVLFAAAEIAGGLSGVLDQNGAQLLLWLFLLVGTCGTWILIVRLAQIAGFSRVLTERVSWSLACVATYATAASSLITWPWPWRLGNDSVPIPQYGWSTRLGGWTTIAIGNTAEVMALGAGARILGTLLVAAAAILPVAVVLVAIRWAARPPRPKVNNRAFRTRRNAEKQLAVRADRHQPGG